MRTAGCAAVVVVVVMSAYLAGAGQARDAGSVLEALRTALGGADRVSGVTTLAVEGRMTRVRPDGTRGTTGFEMYFELPDRFVKKDVVGQLGDAPVTRRSGFNGADLIEEVDRTMAAGGGRVVFGRGAGGAAPGTVVTPEQREATLVASRREQARLLLGLLGRESAVYPFAFAYGGRAVADDGTAEILELTGPDGFETRLFVDATSGLPLMMSWMDREPLARTGGLGGVQMVGPPGSPQDAATQRAEIERRLAEADAARRVVEYRLFFADHRDVDGIRLPRRIQQMIDGEPVEELAIDRIRINRRLDANTFSLSR